MYSVSFKGKQMTIKSNKAKVGDVIKFNLVTPKFKSLKSEDVKGKKVISVFPSINTSICDAQTKGITKLSEKYPEYQFISISLDLPTSLGEWCATNEHQNILIGSDYMEREFGKKYGFLIEEIKLLNRGVIIVDENDKALYVEYKDEIANQINFEALYKFLST